MSFRSQNVGSSTQTRERKERAEEAKYEREKERARLYTERLEEERIDREMHAQVRRGNYNAMVDGRLRATAADRQNMINFYQSRLDDDSNDAETRDLYAKSVAELKKPRTRPPVGWLDS
jgi:hypothetical protein